MLVSAVLSASVWAGPIDPAEKLPAAPGLEEGPPATATKGYLQNGAFDEAWSGDVPRAWQVYPGDADAFGSLEFLSTANSLPVGDNAFVFQIVNDEVKGNRNAYLYQEITLPHGDYWVNVHSTIYGAGTGIRDALNSTLAYNYMAYYAIVPKAEVLDKGTFLPVMVATDAWKELWTWLNVCNEELRGWDVGHKWRDCDYVTRAETVSVAGGEYVFILRAQLKWPDWRAFAYYIFDDIQVIDATRGPTIGMPALHPSAWKG